MKKLQREGKLTSVLTLEQELIPIFILSVENVPAKGHLFLKGNDVASRFAQKPTTTDLAFMFKKLKRQVPLSEAKESVKRYIFLFKF